jgi:hypothetical protein
MRDTHFRHAVRDLLYGDTWSKQEMEWLMSLWHERHSLSQPIKEYDRIVDGPEAGKRLEKEQPGLVAARDQAVVQQKRERIQQELAQSASELTPEKKIAGGRGWTAGGLHSHLGGEHEFGNGPPGERERRVSRPGPTGS